MRANPAAIRYLSLVLICVVISMLAVSMIADDDVFWHLANGRWIWEHKAIPSTDVLSYPTEGVPWIPTEWGWDLLTYMMVTATGTLASLQVLTAVIWIIIAMLLMRLMERFAVPTPLIVLLTVLTLLTSLDRITPRPHLITIMGFALVLFLYVSVRYFSPSRFRRLYLLPILFIVWANMHPGVLAGIFLLGVLLVVEIARTILPPARPGGEHFVPAPLDRKKLFGFAIIFLLSCGAILVNPHGFMTFSHITTHTNLRLMSTIVEWQSPFAANLDSRIFLLYKAALVISAINIFYSLRTRDPLPAMLYMAFGLYSLRAVRFQTDFAVVTLLGTSVSLWYFIDRYSGEVKRQIAGLAATVCSLGVCVLLIVAIPGGSLYDLLRYRNHFGFGNDEGYFSSGLMSFIKSNRISGRPLNHFDIGGWLIWEVPGEKNFIDSRDFDDAIASEYDSIMAGLPGFEAKLAARGIDYVLLQLSNLHVNPSVMSETIIPYCSTHKEQWKLVYWDDHAFLYLRNMEKFDPIIRQKEYRIADPYLYSARHEDFDSLIRGDPMRFQQELKRKLIEEPNGVILNYFLQYARQRLSGREVQ